MVKEKQFLEFGHYIIPKCDVKRVEKEFYKEKNIGTIYMKVSSIYKKDDYEILSENYKSKLDMDKEFSKILKQLNE